MLIVEFPADDVIVDVTILTCIHVTSHIGIDTSPGYYLIKMGNQFRKRKTLNPQALRTSSTVEKIRNEWNSLSVSSLTAVVVLISNAVLAIAHYLH